MPGIFWLEKGERKRKCGRVRYSAVGRMDSVGRRSAGSGKYGNTRTARKRHWRSAGRLHGSGAQDLQDIWKNFREVRRGVQKEVQKEVRKEVRKQLQAEVQQNFRRAAWCIWNREKEKKILQWNPGKPRRSKKILTGSEKRRRYREKNWRKRRKSFRQNASRQKHGS